MGRGQARVARGLVMSATCLLLASTAHVAAGGGAPVHAGFFLVAGLLSVACVGLADRQRSPGEIAALLLFTQPLLHIVLTLAEQHDPAGALTPGPPMLFAHAAAAIVLTVLLAGVESVVWSMASLSATVLLTRARQLLRLPAPASVAPSPGRRIEHIQSPHVVQLVRSTPRRGPPAPAHHPTPFCRAC